MKVKKSLFLQHDFDNPKAKMALERLCVYLDGLPYPNLMALELTPYILADVLYRDLEDTSLTQLLINSLAKRHPRVLKVYYTYEDEASGEREEVDEALIYQVMKGGFNQNLITGEEDEEFLDHVHVAYKLESGVLNDA